MDVSELYAYRQSMVPTTTHTPLGHEVDYFKYRLKDAIYLLIDVIDAMAKIMLDEYVIEFVKDPTKRWACLIIKLRVKDNNLPLSNILECIKTVRNSIEHGTILRPEHLKGCYRAIARLGVVLRELPVTQDIHDLYARAMAKFQKSVFIPLPENPLDGVLCDKNILTPKPKPKQKPKQKPKPKPSLPPSISEPTPASIVTPMTISRLSPSAPVFIPSFAPPLPLSFHLILCKST